MCLSSSPRRSLPGLSAVGLLLLPSGTLAATLRVPAEFTTIRAAVLAAVQGDTILVAPGTYDQGGDLLPIRSGVSLVSEEGYEVTNLLDFGLAHFNDARPAPACPALSGSASTRSVLLRPSDGGRGQLRPGSRLRILVVMGPRVLRVPAEHFHGGRRTATSS
jgi:hypothetical protein